jgi:hypothetical protein
MADPAVELLDVTLQLPPDLSRFELPEGVQRRLQSLLDKQDQGIDLTNEERAEAEGLVDLADMLSLLRLRATRKVVAD